MQYNTTATFPVAKTARALVTLAGAAVFATTLFSSPTVAHAVPPGMHQVWADEFTGASTNAMPNSAVWSFETGAGGWGNNEIQTYVTSWANCHVVWDGTGTDSQALQIRAEKDGAGNFYSARIKTQGKVSFGPYGYYEVRCKFPNAGKGYWPAFWMLGNNISSVGWPRCGEIDIAEEINAQWENHGSLHAPGWDPTSVVTPNSSTTTYHNYGCNWQPDYVTFYVDGNAYATFNRSSAGASWVFNAPTFMILNLAVGGNWPGNPDGSTVAPANFLIDYVRVYQY